MILRSPGAPGREPPFRAALERFFAERDAALVEVPILQPADAYLDTAGEALRRRIFLTRGEGGRSLCLRPDFTIPVAIAHIAAGAGLPRRYAYDGLVFRQGRIGEAEFRQAGLEDLGATDSARADARALADAVASLAACSVEVPPASVVLGDQALFEAYLKALGLPAGWQRRLIRTFGHDDLLAAALEALSTGVSPHAFAGLSPEIVALARAGDRAGLESVVGEMMEEGGLPPHRGRSPAEIATRLIEKVAVADARLDRAVLDRLRRFLAVDCALSQAEAVLAELCGESGVDLGGSLAFFCARNAALGQAGVDLSAIRYRAAFGRPLDYYTGMVFEISAPGAEGPLAGGGRYDRLVSYLGAPNAIPAVGFSLWLDRIAGMETAR